MGGFLCLASKTLHWLIVLVFSSRTRSIPTSCRVAGLVLGCRLHRRLRFFRIEDTPRSIPWPMFLLLVRDIYFVRCLWVDKPRARVCRNNEKSCHRNVRCYRDSFEIVGVWRVVKGAVSISPWEMCSKTMVDCVRDCIDNIE